MSIEKINQAKAEIAATSAYKTITAFFDADSFCEIDAFAKSGEGFAEVVAGFGTVEGMPVYAFAQNSDICGGAMSKAQAAKLKKLYGLALKTGAPSMTALAADLIRVQSFSQVAVMFSMRLRHFRVLYRRSRLFSALASEQTLLTPQAQTSLS